MSETKAKLENNLLRRAIKLQREGRFEEAIATYRRYIELNPVFAWGHHKLGEALSQMGDEKGAIAAYSKAIELNPALAWSHNNIGELFARQGLLDKAVGYYSTAIKNNQNCYEFYNNLGDTLIRQGFLDKAVESYQKAIALDPKNFKAYHRLANILKEQSLPEQAIFYCNKIKEKEENVRKTAKEMMQQKNYEGAVAAYQEAIALSPRQPVGVLIELGECLEKVGKVDEALSCYQQERHLHPYNPYGYVKLANVYYLKKSQWDQAIDNYLKAIKLRPGIPIGFYRRLVDALNQQGQPEEAKKWVNLITQRLLEDEIYLNIWNTLNQTNREKNLDFPTTINPNKVRQYFAETSKYQIIDSNFLETSKIRIICLHNLKEKDRQFLDNSGFSLEFIRLNKASCISKSGVVKEEYINDEKLENEGNSSYKALEVERKMAANFQLSLVRNGCVYAICPTTGKVLKSNTSFSIVRPKRMQVGCYRFVGEEVFYLMSGGHWAQKYSLYFPRIELIVHLYDPKHHLLLDEDTLIEWKTNWVANWQTINSYILNENTLRETVAVVGISENIGHHIWNDLSGIMSIYETDDFQKIDKFLVVGTEFFGSIDEIFPEIPVEKIKRIDTLKGEGGANQEILENNYFAVRLGNSFVKEELAQRIYHVCLKKCSLDIKAKIERAKNSCFPLIWINIRTHSRVWVSQITGIANIIQQLATDYPDLGLVFDGASLIGDKERPPTHSEIVMIEGARVAMEKILALIPKKHDHVYSVIGSMMYESIAWANAIDFYISPVTGGIAKITWIANKPGIMHSNEAFSKMPQWEIRSTGFDRENAVVATLIPKNCIVDIKGASSNIYGKGQSDYDLDWKVIYSAAMEMIPKLKRA